MKEPTGDDVLDARLRAHYAALPGEEAALAVLRAATRTTAPVPSRADETADETADGPARTGTRAPGGARRLLARVPGIARYPAAPPMRWAAAAVVLALTTMTVHLSASLGERTERTVREAAMNHNTRLAPDYPARELVALDEAMQRLPFTLRRPDRLDPSWKPIGARYCSLAGQLAAHVRLADADGRGSISLFVTRGHETLTRLGGEHRGIDGVDVELWEERGLFYVMARSAS